MYESVIAIDKIIFLRSIIYNNAAKLNETQILQLYNDDLTLPSALTYYLSTNYNKSIFYHMQIVNEFS